MTGQTKASKAMTARKKGELELTEDPAALIRSKFLARAGEDFEAIYEAVVGCATGEMLDGKPDPRSQKLWFEYVLGKPTEATAGMESEVLKLLMAAAKATTTERVTERYISAEVTE